MENVVAKKWIFSVFSDSLFRFEVEALFRFSWSALCKRQKLSKAKSRKKVFSKKNFEKRFHDNKKSLSDEKTRFLRTK